MSTFHKWRQLGFFPQNSHTQIPPQTYEFIILGVKPRHLLFQGKKTKTIPTQVILTYSLQCQSLQSLSLESWGWESCFLSTKLTSVQCIEAYQFPPWTSPNKHTGHHFGHHLNFSDVQFWANNWYERGISHSGQNIMGRGWFWCHKLPSSSHIPQTLPEGPRGDL